MISRLILVAEDLIQYTDQGERRGRAVRGVAQEFSRLLREDLKLFYVEGKEERKHSHDYEMNLKKLAKEVSSRTKYEIHTGSPAEEILKSIQVWPRPEMVIMGTQGHTGIEKLLEGSVAEQVLLKSHRPVMVLGPRVQERYQEKNFRLESSKRLKILVATDLSRDSRLAEQYALSLAARTGGEITLFHSVYESIKRVQAASVTSGFASFDMERIFQKMQKDARASLSVKQGRIHRAMVDCNVIIADPNVRLSDALLAEADKGYSAIVMGTHSKRNALLRAFLGSTTRETILQAAIPVVIVHGHHERSRAHGFQ